MKSVIFLNILFLCILPAYISTIQTKLYRRKADLKKTTQTRAKNDKNALSEGVIYLRNKETQQTLRVIVSIQYDASFSANDIYSWERYLSVKLQQV